MTPWLRYLIAFVVFCHAFIYVRIGSALPGSIKEWNGTSWLLGNAVTDDRHRGIARARGDARDHDRRAAGLPALVGRARSQVARVAAAASRLTIIETLATKNQIARSAWPIIVRYPVAV
jgi:hypothetical protein